MPLRAAFGSLRRAAGPLLLPPSGREPLGDAATRRAFRIKRWMILFCIVGDLVLWARLRHSAGLSTRAVDVFAALNVPALALDVILGEIALRHVHAARLWRVMVTASALLVTFTVAVWIQLTGSLTSYFMIASVTVIVLYRVSFDFRAGLTTYVAISAMQAAVLLAEKLHVVRPESLFLAPPSGVYQSPEYSTAATGSLLTFYLFAFLGANFLVNKFREKDAAIGSARRELARVTAEARLGRLSGRTVAGRYELGEILGRGGMGEIYRATRLEDGFDVAVKVLHGHLAAQPAVLERFRREAEAAARLPPDCVARVHETCVASEDEPFIAMDLLHGEDLGALLRREERLELDRLQRLVDQIATGLDAAHDAGVVHRDLKPQNVFLASDGRVILLDFGISRLMEADASLTVGAAVLGSPGYMAPEQARGQVVGPEADVFALGAIVYRALTGRPAFVAGDPVRAIQEALYVHPPAPSHVRPELPASVDDVVTVALAKAPHARYARASELARDLAAAVAGRLPSATRERAAGLRNQEAAANTLPLSELD